MNTLAYTIGDYAIPTPYFFKFGGSSIGEVVSVALIYVFAFAGIGLLLMIIRSGFTLMLSAGDAKKLAEGKASLTNAVIGFIVVFAAFWIVQIIGVVFGWTTPFGISGIFG